MVLTTKDKMLRSMIFTISGVNDYHELPRILYDIDDNNVCYIYAIQDSKGKRSKRIERELYKINKNIENPNIHPNKIYAMIFFINELKQKGISRIVVPSMQVLSYDYHEILKETAKRDLDKAEKDISMYPDDGNVIANYEFAKKWASHCNDVDKISYLKTEELISLIYRLLEHDSNIEVVNDVNIQGDYLEAKIKR